GCERWIAAGLPTASLDQVSAADLSPGDPNVLDVRRASEFEGSHLALARHIPLAQLRQRVTELDRERQWTVICASGYRSAIAASVLERAGLRVRNTIGGIDAYRGAGLPVESGP